MRDNFYKSIGEPNENGCILWNGSLSTKKGLNECGYGIIWNGRRYERAHRYSYEIHYGLIPEGMYILHKCDIPHCVAPNHLFVGTHQDNMKDRSKKNRCNITKGEKSYLAKFTNEEAIKIREIYKNGGISTRQLAKLFDVSQPCINNIIHRRSYKNA